MKKIAYASLAAATFYIALFVTIPLTSYVLAYLIGLYFLMEIVVALFIITKTDPENATKIQLTSKEMESITLAKQANLDIGKLIDTSMSLIYAQSTMGLEDGKYAIVFVKADEKEVLEKIQALLTPQNED